VTTRSPVGSNEAARTFQYPGVAATVDFTHIKRHYYQSHKSINPTSATALVPTANPRALKSEHLKTETCSGFSVAINPANLVCVPRECL
jgi:hypothetical protein